MTRDKRTVSNFLSMDIETWALGESPGVQGLASSLTHPHTGLLGEGTKYLIRHLNRKGEPAVVFIHQWQLYPMPEGSYPPKSYVLRNPAYWPLTRNLVKLLRGFLEEFEFGTMEALAAEYINKGSREC